MTSGYQNNDGINLFQTRRCPPNPRILELIVKLSYGSNSTSTYSRQFERLSHVFKGLSEVDFSEISRFLNFDEILAFSGGLWQERDNYVEDRYLYRARIFEGYEKKIKQSKLYDTLREFSEEFIKINSSRQTPAEIYLSQGYSSEELEKAYNGLKEMNPFGHSLEIRLKLFEENMPETASKFKEEILKPTNFYYGNDKQYEDLSCLLIGGDNGRIRPVYNVLGKITQKICTFPREILDKNHVKRTQNNSSTHQNGLQMPLF